MEIPIDSANGINPKNMEATQRFQIRYNEEFKDVVVEEKRPTKDGKGLFKQYTLFLSEDDGTERELRFLFSKHFKELQKAWGIDTTKWVGKDILVIPQTKGDYADVKLEVAGRRLQEHLVEEEDLAV